jgi:hypothetical protein
MQLILQKFDHAFLVPCSAVIERGGQTYIFEVINDRAHMIPVRVQLEDGVQAKIVKLGQPQHSGEAVDQELTGQESIVLCGQGELADGQTVKCTPASW